MFGTLPARTRSGSTLIVVVAILAILLILAVSFGRLTGLERTAASSTTAAARARFQAEAGVEFAMGRIRSALESGRTDGLWAEQGLDPEGPHRPIDLFGTTVAAVSRYPSEEALTDAGIDPARSLVLREDGTREWESFSIAIRDAQSMIDLNQKSASLARILEALGIAIDESNPPIAAGEGRMIVDHRDSLPAGRFSSVEDLAAVPGDVVTAADLSRLRPYLTVDAWIDPGAVCPSAPSSRPVAGVQYDRRWRPPHLEVESRAPIDVNTASKPVLVAVIAGVAGREEVACVEPSWSNEIATWKQVESDPIDLDTARRVADRIIANRTMDPQAPGAPDHAGPFRSWEQFARFCRAMILDEQFEDVVYAYFRLGIGITDSFVQLTYPAELDADGYYRAPVRTWQYPRCGPSMPTGAIDVAVGPPEDRLRVKGRITFLRPATILRLFRRMYTATVNEVNIARPGGVYYFEGSHSAGASEIVGATSSNGGLTVTTRLTRIRFVPDPDSQVLLSRRQAEALIANFNPNARLNKFNPDASRRQTMDKSDVTVHSTEFCFEPMGAFEIASVGYVHSKDRTIVARAGLVATVRNQEVWRETTQADFLRGQFSTANPSVAPVAGGVGLTTYPQPALGDLRQTCIEDGWIQLSTYEVPSGPYLRLSRGSFDDSFDLDEAGGGATGFADVAGPYAGDLFEPATPGALHPDGAYAARDATPRYAALGNMPGKCGTIAFWVKTNWSISGATWTTHKFFEATATYGPETTQAFQIGIFGWGEPVVGNHYEAQPTLLHESDPQIERACQMPASGGPGEWRLIVASYDMDAELPDRAIEAIIDGCFNACGAQGYNGFSGYDWYEDRTVYPAQEITANANRFSLGGRSGALIGGSSPPDATIDELAIYDGYFPSEIASRLHAVGRYYSGGDATYTSEACPATTGTGVDPSRRVSRIAWTGFVPEGVPGGRLRARVQVGSQWTDWLEDPSGSRVDLPVTGPVRYRIAFEENAVEGSEPLVVSPDLDDVTVYFTTAPYFTRWDANVPPDQVLLLIEPSAEVDEPEPPRPVEEIVFEAGPAGPPVPVPAMPPGSASSGGPIGVMGMAGAPGSPPPPPSILLRPRDNGGQVRGPRRGEKAAQEARDRAPRGRVVIEVVDAETGEPVPRALLTIEDDTRVWADHVHANDRGRLLMTAGTSVDYRLTVERQGYETSVTTFAVEGEDTLVKVELDPIREE